MKMSKYLILLAVACGIAALPVSGFAAEASQAKATMPAASEPMTGHPDKSQAPVVVNPSKPMPKAMQEARPSIAREGFVWLPGDYY